MRSPLILICCTQSEGGTLFIHGVSSALIGNFFDKHSASSFPSLHANYANAVTDQGSLSSPTLDPYDSLIDFAHSWHVLDLYSVKDC